MKILSPTGRIPILVTIVATFAGLVMVLLGAVLAVTYFSSLRSTLGLYGELAARTSSHVRGELRNYLDPAIDQADWTADLIATGFLDPADDQQLGHLLLGALAATPQVTVLAYLSAEKRVVRAYRGGREGESRRIETDPPRDPGFVDRTLRTAAEQETGFWNEILFSERSKLSFINYVRPIRRDGKFIGAVLALVSLNDLSDLVSQVSDDSRGTVFILADKGQVIAHPNLTSRHPGLSKETPTVAIARVGDPVLAEFWNVESKLMQDEYVGEKFIMRQAEVDGQRYVFAHVLVEDYGERPWVVGYHQDAETAEAALQSLQRSAVIGLVILGMGVALAILFGRKIAGPIKTASTGAARIAELDVSQVEPLPRSRFTELDVQARSFNAMLAALRWFEIYVPRSLVRRLVGRGEQVIPSEERDLTILFTDLVGFTSVSETMTASETADLLNHHFALLSACVEDEGGTIDKFIGDALMAFWGAPDPQPDQADRAVRAVCAMARAFQKDNALRASKGLAPVRMRIGLHSGPAVVGNIGAPQRMNYTIVGDTVNTAQRMEALGKEVAPETDLVILASESVVSTLTVNIKTEPVGAFAVKGRAEPVKVFRIIP